MGPYGPLYGPFGTRGTLWAQWGTLWDHGGPFWTLFLGPDPHMGPNVIFCQNTNPQNLIFLLEMNFLRVHLNFWGP